MMGVAGARPVLMGSSVGQGVEQHKGRYVTFNRCSQGECLRRAKKPLPGSFVRE